MASMADTMREMQARLICLEGDWTIYDVHTLVQMVKRFSSNFLNHVSACRIISVAYLAFAKLASNLYNNTIAAYRRP